MADHVANSFLVRNTLYRTKILLPNRNNVTQKTPKKHTGNQLISCRRRDDLITQWALKIAKLKYHFYRAMHLSAKRGIAIACRLSVRPSVCDVGEL